ncbi:MAG: (d)CMP kinase [Gammaproteobacteria bacterium]|nr:(d)CMP kinase [Gammaproteobacteria bacterium]NNM01444.1 (d)CMP kinase [Gammaproteobacteria bacterium]
MTGGSANRAPVIAVDGPGGTGKGTLCQLLAQRLDWRLLDSGALYRLVALAAGKRGIETTDEAALARLAGDMDFSFEPAPAGVEVWLDGENVSGALRTEECGSAASEIAALPRVRVALLEAQLACRRPPGLVADGRDMGTVVFPDADLKIYLTASPEVRAERRYKQLNAKGNSVTLAQLLADITQRDSRDAQRDVSPLKPASDAVVIDTTTLSIADVMREAQRLADERGLGS